MRTIICCHWNFLLNLHLNLRINPKVTVWIPCCHHCSCHQREFQMKVLYPLVTMVNYQIVSDYCQAHCLMIVLNPVDQNITWFTEKAYSLDWSLYIKTSCVWYCLEKVISLMITQKCFSFVKNP